MKEAKAYLGTLNVISIPKDTTELKQQAKDILKNLTSEGTNQATQQGKDAINAVKSLLGTQTSEGTQNTTKSFIFLSILTPIYSIFACIFFF